MPIATKAQLAARAEQRKPILAEIQKAGVRGITALGLARALAIPIRFVVARASELRQDNDIELGPRTRFGDEDGRRYVAAGLLDMHKAQWDAWQLEAKRVRIAALPKRQKKPKPVKPLKPPKAVRSAKPAPNPMDRLWSKGAFAHVQRAAGSVPPPETRGVRSIFEVAA
jgi:hypothetical protein